ncbi:hypothetical protein GCM10020229_62950 [Kitasatospora albolonga]
MHLRQPRGGPGGERDGEGEEGTEHEGGGPHGLTMWSWAATLAPRSAGGRACGRRPGEALVHPYGRIAIRPVVVPSATRWDGVGRRVERQVVR